MLTILHSTPMFLAVAKPPGVATQAPPQFESVESLLRMQLFGTADRNASPCYLAFPHRLDRPVGGVLLAALTKRAASLLGKQFETRKVAKHYLAWVEGSVPEDRGLWVDRLRKIPGKPQCVVVRDEQVGGADSDAREAITEVTVLKRIDDRTLVELCPRTGRMHQLRVQTAHRGHPVVGDRLYGSCMDAMENCDSARCRLSGLSTAEIESRAGPTEQVDGDEEAAGDDRTEPIALHAWKLSFHDPADGRRMTVTCPPPWQL